MGLFGARAHSKQNHNREITGEASLESDMSIFSFSLLLVAYHGMYGKMVAHFVYSLENLHISWIALMDYYCIQQIFIWST